MKELSIEEKARRYDEKLDVARHIYADPSVKEEDKYYIEVIFPEIEESEDERIRKDIIATIHLYYGEPLEDEAKEMIAWLEKLCEHKKFRDSIQVGDKVTRNEDGVLVNLSQLNRVAKKDEKQGEQKPVEWNDKNKEMATGILNYLCFSTDATDLEGFDEWYDWLKSITKEGVLPQPKQEWSEDDERILNQIIKDYEKANESWLKGQGSLPFGNRIKWLKSIKDRIQPQNRWKPSEHEITVLEKIQHGEINPSNPTLHRVIKCLKKLREEDV